MSIIEVKNLTHTYSDNTPFINDAVSDVSFTAEQGEVIGIVGHTGSGKSTLVQHLNGLLKPTNGSVFINEKDIWENPKEIRKIRSEVGLVFQYPEYQLFEETVFEDISFGPKNMGITGEELKNRVLDICKLVGVKTEFFEKSPFDLSGGEKRRVAIAGVMAMRPKVIVFDEPTAGLDPIGRENVLDMIRNYRMAYNATVLIISHSMEDMATLCDRIIVMNKGNAVMFDTPQNIFSKADELRKIGLEVPLVTRVLEAMEKKGICFPKKGYTVSEVVKILRDLKAGEGLA